MRDILLLITILLINGFSAIGQEIYQTRIIHPSIKSLQVKVSDDEFTSPFIQLGEDKQIEISFDVLTHDYKRFAYSIIHCDADWKQSALSPIEYIQGLQGLPIDDYAFSGNTTVQYINHRLLLPNEDTQLKVSGNYAIRVYEEDNPSLTVFIACFSVVEPLVTMVAGISGNTLIDFNKHHQQVNFSVIPKSIHIPHPATDLKIIVMQNNRRDNAVSNITPSAILDNRILYENKRELIFEAGNEYHRFEALTHRYNGMGINSIQFHNPYYHVELLPDIIRNDRSYQYDQDQNGRFFIRCSNCSDPDTEADYYIVHFALESERLLDGNIYLNGDLVNNIFDENSQMTYNRENRRYEKYLLLKGGNYNYQYLFVPNTEKKGTTIETEGNFYQTENEYTICVYYRPMGTIYDRLIGLTVIKSQ